MPDLTSGAEEALLGALIADPDQLASVPGLVAGDFTDPVHQAVWSAISRLRDVASGARGPEFADLVYVTSNNDLVTRDYLTRLAVATPTPGAADVYARMIMEATVIRDFAAHLSEAGEGSDTTITPTMVSYTRNINTARAAAADPRQPGPPPADPRAAREELFLGALMRNPGITDWIPLDPAVFTSPGRRDIYQAITTLSLHGEPVDEITVAWALARATATRDLREGRATTPESFAATIPPGTIARLAACSIDTVTALETGRDLLADHARAQIAGATRRHDPDNNATRTAGPRRHGLANDAARPLLQPPPSQQLHPGPQLRQEGS